MITINNVIINMSETDKQRGYYIKDDKIFFVFAKNSSDIKPDYQINTIEIMGSFTGWKKKWSLKQVDENHWLLEKNLEDIKVPGNSGQPEFKFVLNQNNIISPPEELSWQYKFFDGHSNDFKNIILFSEKTKEKIEDLNKQIINYRIHYDSNYQLANFREITLGNIAKNTLYRSYHPFIKSREEHPLENKRLATVQQLMVDNNINSIINLSDEKEEVFSKTNAYQNIISENNLFLANEGRNYDLFYYITDEDSFSQLLKEIISFILKPDSKRPFLIHCRIGTDRTGVITAILTAFMGAQWEEIVQDYQKSNDLGIKEYRDEKLLHYSFKKLLEEGFENNLQNLMTNYFKDKLKLNQQDINSLRKKLNADN